MNDAPRDYASFLEQDDYASDPFEARPTRFKTIATIIGATLFLAVMMGVALAHSFYEAFCCSGNSVTGDCQPIPDEAVKPIPGGFQITLRPGDHPLVTRLHVFQIEASKARPSPDGRHHACLYPTEDTLRCFYTPPMGF